MTFLDKDDWTIYGLTVREILSRQYMEGLLKKEPFSLDRLFSLVCMLETQCLQKLSLYLLLVFLESCLQCGASIPCIVFYEI